MPRSAGRLHVCRRSRRRRRKRRGGAIRAIQEVPVDPRVRLAHAGPRRRSRCRRTTRGTGTGPGDRERLGRPVAQRVQPRCRRPRARPGSRPSPRSASPRVSGQRSSVGLDEVARARDGADELVDGLAPTAGRRPARGSRPGVVTSARNRLHRGSSVVEQRPVEVARVPVDEDTAEVEDDGRERHPAIGNASSGTPDGSPASIQRPMARARRAGPRPSPTRR